AEVGSTSSKLVAAIAISGGDGGMPSRRREANTAMPTNKAPTASTRPVDALCMSGGSWPRRAPFTRSEAPLRRQDGHVTPPLSHDTFGERIALEHAKFDPRRAWL